MGWYSGVQGGSARCSGGAGTAEDQRTMMLQGIVHDADRMDALIGKGVFVRGFEP